MQQIVENTAPCTANIGTYNCDLMQVISEAEPGSAEKVMQTNQGG